MHYWYPTRHARYIAATDGSKQAATLHYTFFLERATLHLMFTQHAAMKEYGTQALLFFLILRHIESLNVYMKY